MVDCRSELHSQVHLGWVKPRLSEAQRRYFLEENIIGAAVQAAVSGCKWPVTEEVLTFQGKQRRKVSGNYFS